MPAAGPTLVTTGAAAAGELGAALGAPPALVCPAAPDAPTWAWDWAETIASWRREVEALAPHDAVVVCTWPEPAPPQRLLELDGRTWRRRVEWPTALWFATLAAVTGRCRDGGALVVVVDRPATLDAAGHGAEVAVADGLVNLVRSIAAREGGRDVRVNAVVTALYTEPGALPGAPPPLPSFPGRVDREVAGAVRLLLSPDAVGITGSTLAATGGRV